MSSFSNVGVARERTESSDVPERASSGVDIAVDEDSIQLSSYTVAPLAPDRPRGAINTRHPELDPDSTIMRPLDVLRPLMLNDLFPAPLPLHIDVGCGKGRFLVARAKAQPQVAFIGIERLLVRLRRIDKRLRREGVTNVRLLRIEAGYALARLIPPHSVSCVYLFFPDPWPKRRHKPKRLLSPPFIDTLATVLVDGGEVHFASDCLPYYDDVRAMFCADSRFDPIAPDVPEVAQQSDFEQAFLAQGKPIGRCSFRLRPLGHPLPSTRVDGARNA